HDAVTVDQFVEEDGVWVAAGAAELAAGGAAHAALRLGPDAGREGDEGVGPAAEAEVVLGIPGHFRVLVIGVAAQGAQFADGLALGLFGLVLGVGRGGADVVLLRGAGSALPDRQLFAGALVGDGIEENLADGHPLQAPEDADDGFLVVGVLAV